MRAIPEKSSFASFSEELCLKARVLIAAENRTRKKDYASLILRGLFIPLSVALNIFHQMREDSGSIFIKMLLLPRYLLLGGLSCMEYLVHDAALRINMSRQSQRANLLVKIIERKKTRDVESLWVVSNLLVSINALSSISKELFFKLCRKWMDSQDDPKAFVKHEVIYGKVMVVCSILKNENSTENIDSHLLWLSLAKYSPFEAAKHIFGLYEKPLTEEIQISKQIMKEVSVEKMRTAIYLLGKKIGQRKCLSEKEIKELSTFIIETGDQDSIHRMMDGLKESSSKLGMLRDNVKSIEECLKADFIDHQRTLLEKEAGVNIGSMKRKRI